MPSKYFVGNRVLITEPLDRFATKGRIVSYLDNGYYEVKCEDDDKILLFEEGHLKPCPEDHARIHVCDLQ